MDNSYNSTEPTCIESLPWYHSHLSRHVAEVLLLGNGEEGSYLMRKCDSEPKNYCISVRGRSSVKHFQLIKDDDLFTFGTTEFDSFHHLLTHFSNQPILCDVQGHLSRSFDMGTMVTLKYPYPVYVEEPNEFDQVLTHSTMMKDSKTSDLNYRITACPVASKSGYLTKQGGKVKTWKLRWIVLVRNDFSYFVERSDEKPINTISLTECSSCQNCEDMSSNSFCFQLQFPDRVWYFSASSDKDRQDWVTLIRWKLNCNEVKRNAKKTRKKFSNA